MLTIKLVIMSTRYSIVLVIGIVIVAIILLYYFVIRKSPTAQYEITGGPICSRVTTVNTTQYSPTTTYVPINTTTRVTTYYAPSTTYVPTVTTTTTNSVTFVCQGNSIQVKKKQH